MRVCLCVRAYAVGMTVAKQPILAMWSVVWSGSPANFNKGVSGYIMAGENRRREKRGKQEVAKRSAISIMMFEELFWWFKMSN